MSNNNHQETPPVFRPTERRQFQYDALDQAILELRRSDLSQDDRTALEHQVRTLQDVIAFQGGDVGEFEY